LPDDLVRNLPLVLSIDKQGRYYLNIGKDNDKPIAEQVIADRAGAVLRREPKTIVLVKADTNVPYGRVVKGMVLLQQAGAPQIGFITDPLETIPVRKN
jgi:biopolymer transport protein TolR